MVVMEMADCWKRMSGKHVPRFQNWKSHSTPCILFLSTASLSQSYLRMFEFEHLCFSHVHQQLLDPRSRSVFNNQ